MSLKDALKDVAAGLAERIKEAPGEIVRDLTPYAQGGLQDLHGFLQAFPDSQQPATVLGMAGVPTPGEVDREMNGYDQYLAGLAQQQQAPREQQQELS